MSITLKKSLIHTALLLLGYLFFALAAHGQTFDDSINSSLAIQPSLPEPNSTVEVSLNAYSLNTTGASIAWYVDGNEQVGSRNERSITVPTKGIGENTIVRAVIDLPNSPAITISHTITPVVIDLIFEAETTVPSFYKGRALPTEGSLVRAVAQIFDGTSNLLSDYSYEWKLNRDVLFGGSIKGKYAAEITIPRYDGAIITVKVTAPNGTPVGSKAIRIKTVAPKLYFYEMNPLRGYARKPILNTLTLLSDEATVRAEPYYLSKGLSNDVFEYEWRLDGRLVDNAKDDPYTITFRSEGGSGRAEVEFTAVHKEQFSQYVEDSFNIYFE